MKRRILVLLSVVALMVVLLAMSVAPALAAWQTEGRDAGCKTGDLRALDFEQTHPVNGTRTQDQAICYDVKHDRYYDNKILIA
jgi:hypothetical protein